MGESELKLALQREGSTQVAEFWQQAESFVTSRRQESETKVQHLRAETDRQLHAELATLRNNLLFEAQTRAMAYRLHAEAALEERLLCLARQLLPGLAGDNREALWRTLFEELPSNDWTTVTVHPADQALADRDFPAATIEHNEAIGGGLITTNTKHTIRIDNSLSCRLLRAWPNLLPDLLTEIRQLVSEDETTCSDTAG